MGSVSGVTFSDVGLENAQYGAMSQKSQLLSSAFYFSSSLFRATDVIC